MAGYGELPWLPGVHFVVGQGDPGAETVGRAAPDQHSIAMGQRIDRAGHCKNGWWVRRE